ncbi:MAG: DUF3221 domain-containing protein [Gemmatimonadota bacterium]
MITSCEGDPTGPLSEEPLIVGQITDLGTDVGSAGTLGMLVEEVPDKACDGDDEAGCGKVVFYLSVLETTVRIIEGDAFRFVSITELGLGQRVRVWSRGVILGSYPPQTGAGQVDILER